MKYYHFVKLMGRTASKITLEVALQTKPAITLISEEIAEKNMSLDDIVDYIVRIITQRRVKGINHGVILVPEGLVEFIPEMKRLIGELNKVLAEYEKDIADLPSLEHKREFLLPRLTAQSAQLMAALPPHLQEMLILDRDDHGNVKSRNRDRKIVDRKDPLSNIGDETSRGPVLWGEKADSKPLPNRWKTSKRSLCQPSLIFLDMRAEKLKPTRFDAAFTFLLGLTAGSLVLAGKTGYMAAITDFDKGGECSACRWRD